jgi:glutamate-5-semialdehyde dehydrogenase
MSDSSLQKTIDLITSRSRKAGAKLLDVSSRDINACIREMAGLLKTERGKLLVENERDIASARLKKLPPAMIDRLTLSDKTFTAMVDGLMEVARLVASVGQTFDSRKRPNGLTIYKTRVPIGVIGIIYESRPNVTVDAAALCLKSHNAVILRGGSEAFYTNTALAKLFAQALSRRGLPAFAVQLIPTVDRKAIDLLLAKSEDIDLIIPRGGESLIRTVVEKSRIPVIKHYKGICHVFVSKHADMKKALRIVVNAKTQRPGVCNAMETLLLDEKLPDRAKKEVLDALIENKVELFGDSASRKLCPGMRAASKSDWYAEYLDLRLAVRVVGGIDEAVDHINTYGSRHTDAIVTESKSEAARFCKLVDSSSIMVNASTRFSDGGEFGLGCEIGISTDKLHARGPMGIDELTTYKWIVEGNGQIRT